MGIDNGAQPLSVSIKQIYTYVFYPSISHHQLSLFFDVLLCLTLEINQDDYIAGNFTSRAVRDHPPDSVIAGIMQRARAKLWGQIKDIKMKSSMLM